MRNIAKCKLCKATIESFHPTDYVICNCGEIALDGGEALKCFAKDFENFLRVDDEGNEITVKIQSSSKPQAIENKNKPTKMELVAMLDEMASSYEKMPSNALSQSVTYYDLWSVLLLVSQILKAEN